MHQAPVQALLLRRLRFCRSGRSWRPLRSAGCRFGSADPFLEPRPAG